MSDRSANSLLREVGRLHLKLQRACVASCSDNNSATQCFILGEVFRAGPISLADLVRRLALDKGWVSRAVESLVQQGFLTKNPHDNDRRILVVSLSADGEQRYRELDHALDGLAEKVFKRIPRKQRTEVIEALRLLLGALQTETEDSIASCRPTQRAKVSR